MSISERSLFGDAPRPVSLLTDADSELFTIAMALVPGIGARRGNQLIEKLGSARAVFDCSRRELEGLGLSGSVAQSVASGCSFDEAIAQMDRAKALGIHLIPLDSAHYPAALRTIADPPLVLFAKGNLALLENPCIGVVGTRRPTTYGKAVAARLSRDLSELGLTVASGMARGVDTAAHVEALRGRGKTIAVFGCGVDLIYPAENKALAAEIAAHGLILSEYPLGSPAYPQNFPVRNRIVSGISLGILVVEGAQYSGSAITARIAMEQSRLVFAVPGNITSRMSWGPNLLIKQGAVLVQDATDVLNAFPQDARIRIYEQAYGPGGGKPATPEGGGVAGGESDGMASPRAQHSPAEARVLRVLRVDEGKTLDDLLDEFPEMSSSEIIAALFELEMEGAIRQDAGQRYTRIWC
jgi:DNA processing protein